MCDNNERCNFAFWNVGWFCALYETCDELTSSRGTGTIFAKPGKTCPSNEVCHDIKIRTERWGNENSYQLGTCNSTQEYSNYNNYEEMCCLAPGTYTLDCKCSYGDGWHGGYLEIDGTRYCDDFTSGTSKSITVEFN